MSAPSLLHVVGARPNFVKAAPVVEALSALSVEQNLVHTGQHYDPALSDVFFKELDLPEPDRYLGVGSGTHGVQTARLLEAIERTLLDLEPSYLVVYGDINSTAAATLAAVKLHIPVAHVESGLRSFDRTMPEEVNRVVTDALAELHLTTSDEASDNLSREGVPADGVYFVGNTMIDTLEKVRAQLEVSPVLDFLGIQTPFGLVTLHRPRNVDQQDRAKAIVDALGAVSKGLPLVFPVHPRGRDMLDAAGVGDFPGIITCEPLGYLDFMALLQAASFAITDSGGVQEESTALDVPCITVRPNTERPITLSHGTNMLAEPGEIEGRVRGILDGSITFPTERPPLWDGRAGERSAAVLSSWMVGGTTP